MADYIYLEDSCYDRHYCSRCGEPVFAGMERREEHDTWIAAIQKHKTCEQAEDPAEVFYRQGMGE